MSSSPSTSPVYTIHRIVKDAADSGDITNRALGMNMHGFKTGDIRVVPSANSNPTVEVLFWSGEAGKFVSRVHAVETGGFGDGVAFDLPFKAFGGVAFVKVKGGVGSGDTVTITMAGAQRQAAESDILAWFDQVNYTNGDDKRYFWDPINYVLHGPFDANEIAWGWIYGERCVSVFEAVTETTGYTETIAGNWTPTAASLTADQITAPDSAKLADKLTFTADANSRCHINLGSATDDTNQTEAIWVRTLTGTKQFRLGFRRKNNVISRSVDLAATTTWQRFDVTKDIAAGATTPQAMIYNGSGGSAGDIYIWGASVYKDSSFPRQYRTNETGADQVQAKDQLSWTAGVVPAAMRSGKHVIPWIPFAASTDIRSEQVFYNFKDAGGEEIRVRLAANDIAQVRKNDGGWTTIASATAAVWSRGQKMANILDPVAGSTEIQDATSGGVVNVTGAWDTFIPSSSPLYCGMSGANSFHINALIGEPKKKAA